MPDAWKNANDLNPQAQDHKGAPLAMPLLWTPRYVNLEVYLHVLSEQQIHGGHGR